MGPRLGLGRGQARLSWPWWPATPVWPLGFRRFFFAGFWVKDCHGAACGRVRPGRGPDSALGHQFLGSRRGGAGAAQVRDPAWVGPGGWGATPWRSCFSRFAELVSDCWKARALGGRLEQLFGPQIPVCLSRSTVFLNVEYLRFSKDSKIDFYIEIFS